jgi:glucosamine--fructose-6-phosphate aminotransferase (isomerizing)
MYRMLKEIKESPAALERLILREGKKIERIADYLRRKGVSMVTFVARGTSDNAALYGKYLVESTLGIPAHLAAPSVVTIYQADIRADKTLVIGVSQSGAGTDVNRYLENARKMGAMTLGITNTRGSDITRVSDEVIFLHAGHEESVAATKTYTTECMALLMLTAFWAGHQATLDLLPIIPEAADNVLKTEDEIKNRVERLRFAGHAVSLGRGYHYATAQEMALKLMETCYLPTHPFSIADFMHGPIAMIHEGFPIFMFVTRGRTSQQMIDLARNLSEKGSETVIFSNTPETKKYAKLHFMMPRGLTEIATPITYIMPGQLFAYYLSLARGLDPDKPKYLKKVTKTV